MESVTLTGEAKTGLCVDGEHLQCVAELPVKVKLGRKRPKARPQAPLLSNYVDMGAVKPKEAVDYYTKAAQSIARMYLNDTYGDCVWASVMHRLGVWSTNDEDSGGAVIADDREVYDQYQLVCGPGDNGCYIPDVLDYGRSKGWLAGGKRYTIDGYVQFDWTSKELTQIAIELFGCVCIGINLPSAWTGGNIWDVTNTRIVGGHDVSGAGHGAKVLGTNADGVVIMSWGRLFIITWKAWMSRTWLEEAYAMVPTFLWTGLDKKTPSGVELDTLKQDLAKLGGGEVPPLPDPVPPPPPPPPPPPSPPPPPAPPSGFVQIPQLPVHILGFSFGHTDAATVPIQWAAKFGAADWTKIVQDALKLFSDVRNKDFKAALADAIQLLRDFGLIGDTKGAIGPVVPWRVVIMDAMSLASAVMSKDWPAVMQALLKLAADFGLQLM